MLKLIQYIKGYVIIRLWGFSPERFMNLCSNHQLFLWDIVNHGEYYTMCISIKDFYGLKTITRKTGTRVVIQKRCGLPFFVPRMKRRKFFIIGLLGSLAFWLWMSGYIWAIDIQGNFHVTDDVLMEFIQEKDIKIGMKRSAVMIEDLEKSLRREYDIITWTSARIDGTRLVIQVKENELTEAPETEKPAEGMGYDLVAEKDGTVVSIITREGVPLVTEGSQVAAGDVLVQGSVPIFNEDATIRRYQYCKADADIYIRSQYQGVEILPIQYEEKQYSQKEKKSPVLDIFGRRLKLGWVKNSYETYDIVEDMNQVRLLDNFYLPVYFGTEEIREYSIVTRFYTKDEAKAVFSEKVSKIMKTLREKGVQIIEKNVTIRKDNVNWYVDIDFVVVEKAGKNVPTAQLTEITEPEQEPAAVTE